MSDSILDYLAKVMSRKWENFKYLKPECVLTNTSVEDPIWLLLLDIFRHMLEDDMVILGSNQAL